MLWRTTKKLIGVVVVTGIALSNVGCLDARTRAVWKSSCQKCREQPRCAFQKLEAKYCAQCGEPLESRDSRDVDE
ncbi:MAG TPA: hypothetical protein VM487_08585 [Phycisphaerae bacterium]|nr:hypothetical protein [Phycisphaerae bacterium]